MPDVRSTFEQLLGRQASDEEVKGLYRIKNTLGIRDNDALWLVLMALQSYDSLYRRYPERIAEEVRKIVDEQRTLVAETAAAESRRALGSLAEAVSATSIALASSVAEASRFLSWGWMLLGLVLFGSLCMWVGATLGLGHAGTPHGLTANAGFALTIAGNLARTPAGWIVAVGGGGAGIVSAWRLRGDIARGKRLGLLVSALALVVFSASFFVLCLSNV